MKANKRTGGNVSAKKSLVGKQALGTSRDKLQANFASTGALGGLGGIDSASTARETAQINKESAQTAREKPNKTKMSRKKMSASKTMASLGQLKNVNSRPQTAAMRTMDSSKESNFGASYEIPYMEVTNTSLKNINFLSETECRSIEEAVASQVHGNARSRSRTRSRSNASGMLRNKMLNNSSNENLRVMTYRELRKLQKTALMSNLGPGTYETVDEKMPNISFGGRHERSIDKTPGPG